VQSRKDQPNQMLATSCTSDGNASRPSDASNGASSGFARPGSD
jgi:hypothetical protein